MCLAVISTRHPAYSFILLSNRDEFLNRPTAEAHWWAPPHDYVLGGRDLQRETQGTWLGITKQGRLALLTNFRDEGDMAIGQRSRGDIAKAYLTLPSRSDESPKDFARNLVEKGSVQGVGGFSLIFGHLRKGESEGLRSPLGVISNRTPDAEGVIWVASESTDTQAWTCSLSNSRYGDSEWPKVSKAEKLLDNAIRESIEANETEDLWTRRLFRILDTDDLPRPKPGQAWKDYTRELRNSIFIPAVGDESTDSPEKAPAGEANMGKYGTQKQTVILVDHEGKVTFVERTLYDSNAQFIAPNGQDRRFDFHIEGWSSGS